MSTTAAINSEMCAFQRTLCGGKLVIGKKLFFAISKFNPTEEELKAAEAAFELFAKRFGVSGAETLGFTERFSNGQFPYYARLFAAFARAGMLTQETQEWAFQRFLVSALLPKDFNSGFPGWSHLQKINKAGQYGTPQWVELQAGLVDYQDTYVFGKLPTMSCMNLRVVLLQRLVAARERKSLLSEAVTRYARAAEEKKTRLNTLKVVAEAAAEEARQREYDLALDEFECEVITHCDYIAGSQLMELCVNHVEDILHEMVECGFPVWQLCRTVSDWCQDVHVSVVMTSFTFSIYTGLPWDCMVNPGKVTWQQWELVEELQQYMSFMATVVFPLLKAAPFVEYTFYLEADSGLPITPEPFGEGLVEFVSECEKAEVITVAPLAWAKEPVPIVPSVEEIAPKKMVLWCDDVNDYIVPPSAPPAKPWADDEEDLDSLGDPEKLFMDWDSQLIV